MTQLTLTLSRQGLRKVWLCLGQSEAEGDSISRPPARLKTLFPSAPCEARSHCLQFPCGGGGGGPMCTESDGTSLQRDCTRLHSRSDRSDPSAELRHVAPEPLLEGALEGRKQQSKSCSD